MAPRLKVFVTSDGLTDYVVAASSRPKALAAWGVRQDLFKEGRARETDDKALVEAASARPGEVLRRPAGSREALSKLKAPPKAGPPEPSKAALRRLAALEAKLESQSKAHQRALDAIAGERDKLGARLERLRAAQAVERGKLVMALAEARVAVSSKARASPATG